MGSRVVCDGCTNSYGDANALRVVHTKNCGKCGGKTTYCHKCHLAHTPVKVFALVSKTSGFATMTRGSCLMDYTTALENKERLEERYPDDPKFIVELNHPRCI